VLTTPWLINTLAASASLSRSPQAKVTSRWFERRVDRLRVKRDGVDKGRVKPKENFSERQSFHRNILFDGTRPLDACRISRIIITVGRNKTEQNIASA